MSNKQTPWDFDYTPRATITPDGPFVNGPFVVYTAALDGSGHGVVVYDGGAVYDAYNATPRRARCLRYAERIERWYRANRSR